MMPELNRQAFKVKLKDLAKNGATQTIKVAAQNALDTVTVEGRSRSVLPTLSNPQSTESEVLAAIGNGTEFFMRGRGND